MSPSLLFFSGKAGNRGTIGIVSVEITGNPVCQPVPEPSTMVLLGSGFAGLHGYGRRRLKKLSYRILGDEMAGQSGFFYFVGTASLLQK
jgi:hypothetical protein